MVASAPARVIHAGITRRLRWTPGAHPVLELLMAKLAEQPPPLLAGALQVGHPQLDVMQASGDRLVHAAAPLSIVHGASTSGADHSIPGPTRTGDLPLRGRLRFPAAPRGCACQGRDLGSPRYTTAR